jgi:NADH-quinone oxidoreductase subunit F
MSKNLSELSGRKGLENNLFERLSEVTGNEEKMSVDELNKVADEFLIGAANAYGTITFYDFLRPENQGKKVYVCNGSACLCAGTQEKVIQSLEKHFEAKEIGHMTCLGRCHENHAFHLNGQNFSGNSIESIKEILSEDETSGQDDYHIHSHGKQILINGMSGPEEFVSNVKQIISTSPEDILLQIIASKLRGRGGAGFPIGLKLESCRNADGDSKFIICNADEGDPGAYSDRYLLEKQIWSVLLGMMIAGYTTGANYGVLYIRGEYPESIKVCQSAIKDLHSQKCIGGNIFNSGFDFHFKIIKAQGAYICGEETALINSIEGQRPEVRIRPPYPTQNGLFNRPTVVNNVETLAALPYILKNGGEAYASIGTGRSSGTKLLCLDSGFNRPGLYEVEMGTPLRIVIEELGQGFSMPVKAMQIGGPLGGIVPVSEIDRLTVDFESFAQNGFLLGHASFVCIPEHFPMIKYLEHLFDFASYESCGKCFPCRLGTKRGHEMMTKAINEEYKIDRTLLGDLLDTLEQGSLCAHGGGIPLPVRNALHYFENELSPYIHT